MSDDSKYSTAVPVPVPVSVPVPVPKAEAGSLGLVNGLNIAVKFWGAADAAAKVRILAVHGWLDSAASYDKIAPLLLSIAQKRGVKMRIACLDFLGHGLSSYRPRSSAYELQDRALEIAGAAEALQWDTFVLMAHSMGAGASTLFTGAFPERVERLILFDGVGSFPTPLNAPKMLRAGIQQQFQFGHRARRVYPSVEAAAEKYMRNNRFMKAESAHTLLQRCTKRVEVWAAASNEIDDPDARSDDSSELRNGNGNGNASDRNGSGYHNGIAATPSNATTESDGSPPMKRETGVIFRHDTRCMGRSMMRFTLADNIDFCKAITCPSLVFLATKQWRNTSKRKSQQAQQQSRLLRRVYSERLNAFPDCTVRVVDASHHLHLDVPHKLAPAILDFILDPNSLPDRGNVPKLVDDQDVNAPLPSKL
jgi:pimeloyl-ACP methyl ester carboxylesterase